MSLWTLLYHRPEGHIEMAFWRSRYHNSKPGSPITGRVYFMISQVRDDYWLPYCRVT